MDIKIYSQIVLSLVGISIGLQLGYTLNLFSILVWKRIYRRRKPWTKYNICGVRRLIHYFGIDPKKLKFEFNGAFLDRYNNDALDAESMAMAQGIFNYQTCKIEIDTKLLRSHRRVVRTLLHEICHWNQYNQGRLLRFRLPYNIIDMRGQIKQLIETDKAMEREADAFARTWLKTAMELYHATPDAKELQSLWPLYGEEELGKEKDNGENKEVSDNESGS